MQRLFLFVLVALIVDSCVSGKAALKKGDYYDAVLESVHRLRSSPDNKKAKAVLAQGYPLAIDFIDTSIKNGIDADDPNKWRNAVKGYEQINFLYDQIRTSPGAMKVIVKPVTRFNELKVVKGKAAEESYTDGINDLMKNTREDAKKAYFAFKAADELEPGYRESIEMKTKAEFVATIRVVYKETNQSNSDRNITLLPVVNSMNRLFLSFKPEGPVDPEAPPNQHLEVVFSGYRQDAQPSVRTSTENVSKEIKVGEHKGPDGKTVADMQKVSASITTSTKTWGAASRGALRITDAATQAMLQDVLIEGRAVWQHSWSTFTGDVRALSADQQSSTKRANTNPSPQYLYDEAMRDLEANLKRDLQSFYQSY